VAYDRTINLITESNNTCDGYVTLTLMSSLMRSMHSKKNRWCCLRVFVSLVTGKPTKNCFEF
jgi:hypothetical protein